MKIALTVIAILTLFCGVASARTKAAACCAKSGGVCAVQCCNGDVVSGSCLQGASAPAAPARTSTPVAIVINGYRYETTGIVTGGRTLVPLRGIFETLGAQVEYIRDTGDIVIRQGSRAIILRAGSASAKSFNDVYYLEAPPTVIHGVTYVPLRFIAEFLGVHVDWNYSTNSVLLTSGRYYSEPHYFVW